MELGEHTTTQTCWREREKKNHLVNELEQILQVLTPERLSNYFIGKSDQYIGAICFAVAAVVVYRLDSHSSHPTLRRVYAAGQMLQVFQSPFYTRLRSRIEHNYIIREERVVCTNARRAAQRCRSYYNAKGGGAHAIRVWAARVLAMYMHALSRSVQCRSLISERCTNAMNDRKRQRNNPHCSQGTGVCVRVCVSVCVWHRF